MKMKQLGRRRRQRTSQPRSCRLGQFHCIGQFPGQYRRWCQVCDDHSVGPGIHRYESCRGVTCQEVYGQNTEKSSKERVAREETPDKAPNYTNWGRVEEIIGDQVAGLERYVEAPDDAEPSHTEVATSERPMKMGCERDGCQYVTKEYEPAVAMELLKLHDKNQHTQAMGGSTTERRCQVGQLTCLGQKTDWDTEVRLCDPCYNHFRVCFIPWCQGEVCQYDMEK